jgi:elongation factor P
MQFSYSDEEFYHFMDNATYDMIALTPDQVGDTEQWIIDGMNVEVLFFNGKAISVDAPESVELTVVETPPNFKGDSQGGKKPATLDSGAVVQVPFHIVEGDKIKVNTVEGVYSEKVK